jgi:hypothetical protein
VGLQTVFGVVGARWVRVCEEIEGVGRPKCIVQLRTAAIGHQKSGTLLPETVELNSICSHHQNFTDTLGKVFFNRGI